MDKYIRRKGWQGTVKGLPQFKNGLCKFMALENDTEARVVVNSCGTRCDFREGDKVNLSGWLINYHGDELEIAVNGIDAVVSGDAAKSSGTISFATDNDIDRS
jgi:hypothetical protein